MKQWKKLMALVLALVMTLSLAACGNNNVADDPSTDTNAPSQNAPSGDVNQPEVDEPETLTVGTVAATATFDPTTNSECGLGIGLVFDSILKTNYETMEIEPHVASSWEWVDSTTLKLTIRDDVYFSNGDQLTPSDILYSMSRFVYENTQFDSGFDIVDFDACTIEGNILTLYLTETSADFLSYLTGSLASIVNEDYVKANPDSWWDAPCGSGPYICLENVDGSHSSYTLRDEWWGEMPDAENVVVKNYSEATTMLADLENRVIDIALNVSADDYLLAVDGGYGDHVTATLFSTYDIKCLCLPEYTAAFDDIRVRQAFSLAMDTAAITKALYGDLGQVADSVLFEGVQYYTPIGIHEYNPERAKDLMAEAGYADGMTLRVIIPNMPANNALATIVQAYLDKIGVTLNIEAYDFATAIPMLMRNETDVSIYGSGGGYTLASQMLETLSANSTNGGARVTDPEFNQYLDAARSCLDEAERQEYYTQAQQWAFDNYRTLPICVGMAAVLHSDSVSNLMGKTASSVRIRDVIVN